MSKINKILLVDDDQLTNMMHSRLIKRSGSVSEIDVATDGVDALAYLKGELAAERKLPELIFLDINMPRMGGFEFLEHYAKLDLKGEIQQVIIMLSTSLLPKDHARAEADPNVKCFANKPISAEEFIEIVQEAAKAQAGECDWGEIHNRISTQTRLRSTYGAPHQDRPM